MQMSRHLIGKDLDPWKIPKICFNLYIFDFSIILNIANLLVYNIQRNRKKLAKNF